MRSCTIKCVFGHVTSCTYIMLHFHQNAMSYLVVDAISYDISFPINVFH